MNDLSSPQRGEVTEFGTSSSEWLNDQLVDFDVEPANSLASGLHSVVCGDGFCHDLPSPVVQRDRGSGGGFDLRPDRKSWL